MANREEFGLCKAFINHPVVLCCVNTFRWVPVVFIVAVVVWGYYAYVIELCIFTIENVFEKVLYIVFFNFFLLLFLWAYYQTIFAPIGCPKAKFILPPDLIRDLNNCSRPSDHRLLLERFVRDSDLPVIMRAYDGAMRFCEKCTCIKPDRCHHCSVCGQCVLKFDHHCPWVNTCVNYRNYKFFIQFLGYALLVCVYVFLTDIKYFILFWTTGMNQNWGASKFHIMFMFFVSGMFAISVSALFFYHLWLTGKNRSTIESFRAPMFTYGPDSCGFNLGWRENYKEVFGENKLLWFLPVFSSRGDGCTFAGRNMQNSTVTRSSAVSIRRNSSGERPPAQPRRDGHTGSPTLNGDIVDRQKDQGPGQDFLLGEMEKGPIGPASILNSSWKSGTNPSHGVGPEGPTTWSYQVLEDQGHPCESKNYWKWKKGDLDVNLNKSELGIGAYKALDSRGDGLAFPTPMVDPEADGLLNRRHPKWEDDGSTSDSSNQDNQHGELISSTTVAHSSYRPRNNNWIINNRDTPFEESLSSVPIIVTQS